MALYLSDDDDYYYDDYDDYDDYDGSLVVSNSILSYFFSALSFVHLLTR